jgi:small-conductance mechanosensitive channel
VVGFAAQKTIANFLAGLQIAFTQPIRFDDVVIVEGEWGRIEEITLTYVVVKIWDLRTMILPITYFVEKPFQNWTRHTAEILGTAFIYADYSLPVEEVRMELQRLARETPLWDGGVCELAVTNLTDNVLELRALISARNSGDAFDFRCLIREKLIQYIRNNYPESLPRYRANLSESK